MQGENVNNLRPKGKNRFFRQISSRSRRIPVFFRPNLIRHFTILAKNIKNSLIKALQGQNVKNLRLEVKKQAFPEVFRPFPADSGIFPADSGIFPAKSHPAFYNIG